MPAVDEMEVIVDGFEVSEEEADDEDEDDDAKRRFVGTRTRRD